VSPAIVFDVNGYYRALGFRPPYTSITRKDLRLAYHKMHGEESVWLTAVMKQLLDRDKRRAYDAAPLGGRHLDEIEEKEILAEIKRKVARERRGASDSLATMTELLAQMGFDPASTTNGSNPNGQYPGGEDKASGVVHTDDLPPWGYGFYRWSSRQPEIDRLSRWQELLVSQFAAQEVSIKFCVGFIGRGRTDSRFVVATTYGVRTVYLREDLDPDQEMAAAAVASFLSGEIIPS
jgi:hypothetical protein